MYQAVVSLLNPYIVLWLLLGLAIANLWHQRRESRGRLLLVTLVFVGLTIECLPVTGYLALGSLEWHYPPLRHRPADVGAIVVLGGSVLPADAGRAHAELGRSTFARCQYAVEVYRQRESCPILVSGGRVDPDPATPAVSHLMHDYLVSQGVPPGEIITEDQSRTSHENAVESARLLSARKIRKIVLVTEATHMIRAESAFRKQGLDVVPAPCNARASNFSGTPFDFLPSPKAALDCQEVLHEWIGLAWYWLHGRI
jgi:uncharacterized SAM-binding protein YcdF (DUF218 family)